MNNSGSVGGAGGYSFMIGGASGLASGSADRTHTGNKIPRIETERTKEGKTFKERSADQSSADVRVMRCIRMICGFIQE